MRSLYLSDYDSDFDSEDDEFSYYRYDDDDQENKSYFNFLLDCFK